MQYFLLLIPIAYLWLAVSGLVQQFRADDDTYPSTTLRIQAVGVALCIACVVMLFTGAGDFLGYLALAMPVFSIGTFILALRARGPGHSAVAYASAFYLLCLIASVIWLMQQSMVKF